MRFCLVIKLVMEKLGNITLDLILKCRFLITQYFNIYTFSSIFISLENNFLYFYVFIFFLNRNQQTKVFRV